MKKLIILKSPEDLHQLLIESWIQDYRSTNTTLPTFNYPIAVHFDNENKTFVLKELSDETFAFNAANQAEFVELIQYFGSFKPRVEYDVSKLCYPIVLSFDASSKTYTIKETEIYPVDNSSKPPKKGWFQKNWKWVLIGVAAAVVVSVVVFALV